MKMTVAALITLAAGTWFVSPVHASHMRNSVEPDVDRLASELQDNDRSDFRLARHCDYGSRYRTYYRYGSRGYGNQGYHYRSYRPSYYNVYRHRHHYHHGHHHHHGHGGIGISGHRGSFWISF